MKDTTLRNPMKMALALALAGVLAFAISALVGAKQAWAGGFQDISALTAKSSYYTPYLGKKADLGSRGFISTKKISNVKSGNKAVATAKAYKFKEGGQTYYTLVITLKKAGSTKLSFSLGGKKRTVKFVAQKYANPVKSLKVGSKQYKSAFAAGNLGKSATNRYSAVVKSKPFTGKLAISCAKGWKLVSMNASDAKSTKKVKNGSSVKAASYLDLELKNTKTGMTVAYGLSALSGSEYANYLKYA